MTAQSHLPGNHDVQNGEALYHSETRLESTGEHKVSENVMYAEERGVLFCMNDVNMVVQDVVLVFFSYSRLTFSKPLRKVWDFTTLQGCMH